MQMQAPQALQAGQALVLSHLPQAEQTLMLSHLQLVVLRQRQELADKFSNKHCVVGPN